MAVDIIKNAEVRQVFNNQHILQIIYVGYCEKNSLFSAMHCVWLDSFEDIYFPIYEAVFGIFCIQTIDKCCTSSGGRRFSEGTSADREIQRTLMEVIYMD